MHMLANALTHKAFTMNERKGERLSDLWCGEIALFSAYILLYLNILFIFFQCAIAGRHIHRPPNKKSWIDSRFILYVGLLLLTKYSQHETEAWLQLWLRYTFVYLGLCSTWAPSSIYFISHTFWLLITFLYARIHYAAIQLISSSIWTTTSALVSLSLSLSVTLYQPFLFLYFLLYIKWKMIHKNDKILSQALK